LAAAKAWSSPISCSIEESGTLPLADSQPPGPPAQSMPGLVAVGKSGPESGATPAAAPVSVNL
jgi:hypothetical protein